MNPAVVEEEILENPSRQYCQCHLSPAHQDALQRDLDLAWRVQASLLPDRGRARFLASIGVDRDAAGDCD